MQLQGVDIDFFFLIFHVFTSLYFKQFNDQNFNSDTNENISPLMNVYHALFKCRLVGSLKFLYSQFY